MSTIAVVAACSGSPGVPTDPAASPGDGCPPILCGSNDPRLTELRLGQLNAKGVPNSYGVRVLGFVKDGQRYRMAIDRGQMRAVDGGRSLVGPDLVGGELLLRGPEHRFRIAIREFHALQYWFEDTRPEVAARPSDMPIYRLEVKRDEGEWRNLCQHPPEQGYTDPRFHRWAAIVRGRYNLYRVQPIPRSARAGWFNFACAGQALFKMKRLGYHMRRGRDRSAAVKMITATYCPVHRFTEHGMTVNWQNRHDNVVPRGGGRSLDLVVADIPETVEAVWSPTGMTCLSKPRNPAFTRARVLEICGLTAAALPECSQQGTLRDILRHHRGEWISLTPP